MVAPIISISSDSSEESVGSRSPRVILFGAIPAIIPVIPEVLIVPVDPLVASEVGTVLVVSPVGVLDLVDYSSSSDSDPLKDSLPFLLDLPLVSPSGSSSYDTLAPSSEFPLAPIRVGPIPARRLAQRCVSHHSSDRHSLLDLSSSRSRSDYSLSGHTAPDTTDADSSTPQRFVHRSLASSSFKRSLDLSLLFSRPSRKRCRAPTALVPSPTHDSRSIAPPPIDLLPPRKRFRDLYSPTDSGEEQMEVDIADAEVVTDVGISDGVIAHTRDGVGMRVEITASDVRKDDEEFEAEASASDTRKIVVDPLAIGDNSESSC
nr:hypothetical protein [Tanacetum cinerariifolium]